MIPETPNSSMGSQLLFECPNCGSTSGIAKSVQDRFEYGTGATATELSTQIVVTECASCGSRFLTESAEAARHDAICRHLNLLTPSEIRRLRVDVASTQAEFAKLTGIGKASLARWETGELIQNTANDRLLRLMRYPDNVRRLRAHMTPTTQPVQSEMPTSK